MRDVTEGDLTEGGLGNDVTQRFRVPGYDANSIRPMLHGMGVSVRWAPGDKIEVSGPPDSLSLAGALIGSLQST